jgi:hypothetical protein
MATPELIFAMTPPAQQNALRQKYLLFTSLLTRDWTKEDNKSRELLKSLFVETQWTPLMTKESREKYNEIVVTNSLPTETSGEALPSPTGDVVDTPINKPGPGWWFLKPERQGELERTYGYLKQMLSKTDLTQDQVDTMIGLYKEIEWTPLLTTNIRARYQEVLEQFKDIDFTVSKCFRGESDPKQPIRFEYTLVSSGSKGATQDEIRAWKNDPKYQVKTFTECLSTAPNAFVLAQTVLPSGDAGVTPALKNATLLPVLKNTLGEKVSGEHFRMQNIEVGSEGFVIAYEKSNADGGVARILFPYDQKGLVTGEGLRGVKSFLVAKNSPLVAFARYDFSPLDGYAVYPSEAVFGAGVYPSSKQGQGDQLNLTTLGIPVAGDMSSFVLTRNARQTGDLILYYTADRNQRQGRVVILPKDKRSVMYNKDIPGNDVGQWVSVFDTTIDTSALYQGNSGGHFGKVRFRLFDDPPNSKGVTLPKDFSNREVTRWDYSRGDWEKIFQEKGRPIKDLNRIKSIDIWADTLVILFQSKVAGGNFGSKESLELHPHKDAFLFWGGRNGVQNLDISALTTGRDEPNSIIIYHTAKTPWSDVGPIRCALNQRGSIPGEFFADQCSEWLEQTAIEKPCYSLSTPTTPCLVPTASATDWMQSWCKAVPLESEVARINGKELTRNQLYEKSMEQSKGKTEGRLYPECACIWFTTGCPGDSCLPAPQCLQSTCASGKAFLTAKQLTDPCPRDVCINWVSAQKGTDNININKIIQSCAKDASNAPPTDPIDAKDEAKNILLGPTPGIEAMPIWSWVVIGGGVLLLLIIVIGYFLKKKLRKPTV